ncbi:MAG: patatin-like phospholipase family protein [Rhodospirillaceae bacterium]|jgi:NTE family protein|nr:patatin-like phospholipase family protein [Rhodospirillaceae bacterium]MBT5458084.1 patatin-like phospholipase family protein [Rhodospirillaceae bacterium]
MSQFRNLVFEGGGVKGIAYVGAMQVLEERGIIDDIVRVGGTSAGAINAVLFACGYTNEEQQKILGELDFNDFMDDSLGVVRDTNRLIEEFGWHKGQFFRDWIGGLIARKMGSANSSFRDFEAAGRPDLYLYGANLSTGFGEVFSVEHTPTMRVVDAVRISMSLPLFFAAIRNPRGDVFVDGGLLNNYPIKLFDRAKYVAVADPEDAARKTEYYDKENDKFLSGAPDSARRYVYNCQTLGFRLDSAKEIAAFRYGDVEVARQIDGFFDYTKALIATLLNNQEALHLHGDDWQRTVYINTLDVKSTDFDLKDETKSALVQSGRQGTEKYFEWFFSALDDEAPVNRID